jgi:hypothetical protein
MAQESGSQNKTVEFLKNNPIYVIVGLLAIMLVVYLIATSGNNNDNTQDSDNQSAEQTDNGQNQPENGDQNSNQNGDDQTGEETDSQNQEAGANVNVSGTLQESDNQSLGNLMVESESGKIYVNTGRDFSSLIGTKVELNAEGTLNSFRFIGFNDEAKMVDEVDDTAKGGAQDEVRNVTFAGTLRSSDNSELGNYVITSGGTNVYLQTARDYSAWVDQTVTLQATGSLNSFTNALLVR